MMNSPSFTPPQTAKNGPQTPSTADNRPVNLHQQKRDAALQKLFIESGSICTINEGVPGSVRALSTVLSHWILIEYKQLARSESDEDLEWHEEVIKGTLSAIEFIVNVSECHNIVRSWNRAIEEKEVGRG